MKPVMLATDGSPTAEKAAETAIELAQLLETELVVVTVWSIPYPMTNDLAKLGEGDAQKVAAKAAAHAREEGVETRILVLRGFPVDELCRTAEELDPCFLVIGSHGWGVVKCALFGSVSTGVLHQAKCPVLVVRGENTGIADRNGKVAKRAHV
jgi:nucleotide-binding universal stress UspA family protein